MPTYQYACTECAESLEAVQSFTDDPLTMCPACGGRLRKVFSAVGVVFKGSGFYRNDSRTASSANGSRGSDTAGKQSTNGESSGSADGSGSSSDSSSAGSTSSTSSSSSSDSSKSSSSSKDVPASTSAA